MSDKDLIPAMYYEIIEIFILFEHNQDKLIQ